MPPLSDTGRRVSRFRADRGVRQRPKEEARVTSSGSRITLRASVPVSGPSSDVSPARRHTRSTACSPRRSSGWSMLVRENYSRRAR